MEDPVPILKVISDDTRFAIVTLLLSRDLCAGAIARRLGVSDAAVSQHMKVLREAGLVSVERRGYFAHYSVDRGKLIALSEMISDMAGWARLPCDPDMEGCVMGGRGSCPKVRCRSAEIDGAESPGSTAVSRDEKMRIAVTYENGEVFQHFGRTSEFKLYDIQDGAVVSSEVVGTGGKGHGELIGVLRQLGVSALICGGLGEGARQGLEASGIRVCSGNTGSADEAASRFADGSLGECSRATCDHHGHDGDHQCNCGRHS